MDKGIDAVTTALTAAGQPLAISPATINGISLPMFDNAPPSLSVFFDQFCQRWAMREFIVAGEERLTFADISHQSRVAAAALQKRYRIAKGDRVAIALRNHPEWIIAFMAVVRLGAVAVPLNAWWTGAELAFGLADSGACLLIADEERLHRLAALGPLPPQTLAIRTGPAIAAQWKVGRWEEVLATAGDAPAHLPALFPEDDALILYTAGSTGQPKGVISTQRAIVTSAMSYLLQALVIRELAVRSGTTVPEQPIMLLNIPLFHTTGLMPAFLASMAMGRKIVMMRKWDAGDALRLIEAEGVTYFLGVPAMSLELAQHPDRDRYNLSSLMELVAGGGPRPVHQVEQLWAAFPDKHPGIGYGLTETNTAGTTNLRANYRQRPHSAGRPVRQLTEIKIMADDGLPQSTGRRGEVWIRSAINARGYWMQPEATAETFLPDGWVRTGDIGQLDEDGYLTLLDRQKNIIIRGGENISAQEVETALGSHPALAEVCVFGLPDNRLGEVVSALVVLKAGEHLEPDALIEHGRRTLAPFKLPAHIWFSDGPLPKLGSGKVDQVGIKARFRDSV